MVVGHECPLGELGSLLHLLQFQAEAFRDLCTASLEPLLRQLESLADEFACLLKHASAPQDEGTASLLRHGVQRFTDFLLHHGDLRGLPFSWCSRLRQQQLAVAKHVLVQALEQWHLGCQPRETATRLRLELCMHLATALTLGDTSVEEELTTSALSRLVALVHGCLYPSRTAARAVQLLGECCARAQWAEREAGGRSACSPLDAGPGGGQASRQEGRPQGTEQQQQAAVLQQQLPGIRSAMLRLLRHGNDIEAFHLQLLDDFLSEHCAVGAAELGEGGQEPSSKRARRVVSPPGATAPASNPQTGAASAPRGAATTPGTSASPPPGWSRRVAQAKQVLRCIHFRDLAQRLAPGADRLQRYAALLVMAEIFRGHVGPGETASGDAIWEVTQVAAGAAAAAGLQPLLVSLLQGAAGPGSGAASSRSAPPSPDQGGGAAPLSPVAGAAPEQDCTCSSGEEERAVLVVLALDALAHTALAAGPAGIAGAAAHPAAQAAPPLWAGERWQGVAGPANTSPAGAPVGLAVAAAAAAAAANAVPRPAPNPQPPSPPLLQLPPLAPDGPLPQRALLEGGLQLLRAPDFTSRRLGCNVVSLCAQCLAFLAPEWRPHLAGVAHSPGDTRAAGGEAGGGLPGAEDAGQSAAAQQGGSLAAAGAAPAGAATAFPSNVHPALHSAVHLYCGLAGLDEGLAGMLAAEGIRCRLSALGAVYRIAALAPHLFPLAAGRVVPLLSDPHPDSGKLRVPQLAAAALARLAGSTAIRAQLQWEGVPRQLLGLLVSMAASIGEDESKGDSSAVWAAGEGLEALARLAQPLPSRLSASASAATSAEPGGEAGASDGSAASMQQVIGDLLRQRGTCAVIGALRQLQGTALDQPGERQGGGILT